MRSIALLCDPEIQAVQVVPEHDILAPSFVHNQSAASLAQGLRDGRWTSVALTEHFLRRIREINPQIHAVPFVFEKEALAQARESDARCAAGSALTAGENCGPLRRWNVEACFPW